MIHDVMPGAEEHLLEHMRAAYVGFDPTADSLHIGFGTHYVVGTLSAVRSQTRGFSWRCNRHDW